MMLGMKFKVVVALCIASAVSWFATTAYSQADTKTPVADMFKDNCASCHGDDGAGSALGKRLHSPDLRSKEIHDKPTAELVKAITEGKDKMPPFEGQLSADHINALVEYIRTLHGNSAPAPK
jgi:mono/diheme cytochrome c family protein